MTISERPSSTPFAVPALTGISSLAGRYDALVCDLWGVVHDGIVPYGSAVDALIRFRAGGGRVVLLSNAPRPRGSVAAQLARIGVDRRAWDAIVSSGDLTRAELAVRAGAKVHHIGPDRDLAIFEGLDVSLVRLEEAQALVCSGLDDDEAEAPDDYRDRLEAALARKLPMLCANPDRRVMRGDRAVYCAGAIAELYEGMGGDVTWLGKPYPKAYAMVEAVLAELPGGAVPRSRLLAVGDGIHTDIAGARDAGIDAVLVTGGLHAEEFGDTAHAPDAARVAKICAGIGARPVGFLARLAW